MTAVIPARFNGPPESGNGGYSCGVLARNIPGAARVRLFSPPPLDTEMSLSVTAEGEIQMHHGAAHIASAWPSSLELDIPPAPGLSQAREAAERYLGHQDHYLPTCFVCGPGRAAHDGLEIYPGPVDDWSLLACAWEPAADMLDAEGNVHDEIVWGALDCPGYFAAGGPTPPNALLGELTAEIYTPVPGREALVVYCWPLGSEGRKSFGATAIASAEGGILAASRSTWITLKSGSR